MPPNKVRDVLEAQVCSAVKYKCVGWGSIAMLCHEASHICYVVKHKYTARGGRESMVVLSMP